MIDTVVIPQAGRASILAIQKAQSQIDRATMSLSSGLKVASALDNPSSFFVSRNLQFKSQNLNRVLLDIEKNISTVKAASQAAAAVEKLLQQADSIVDESIRLFSSGQVDSGIYEKEIDKTPPPLSSQILGSNPVGYWQLNETAGTTAVNQGSGGAAINGTYQNGVSLGNPGLYSNSPDTSASFDGVNDRVVIPNSALINVGNQSLRTVELVFNADTTTGRQILYEEGGNTNSLNIYINNGRIYFNTRDAGSFGPFAINTTINAGETYHAAIVFDAPNNTVSGYLNGELVGTGVVTGPLSSHTDGIGIGSLNGSSYMHDGPSPANTYRFNGFISDVALYNRAMGESEVRAHAQSINTLTTIEYRHESFDEIINQIDLIVSDSGFRGQFLLDGSNIKTYFNESRESELVTEGLNISSAGLGLIGYDFNNEDDLNAIKESVQSAIGIVRDFLSTLQNDLSIMEARRVHTLSLGNTYQEGSDQLINADQNEVGAMLLASQTRMQLAVTALGLANISGQQILRIFA